jgi:hypothetical protein
VSHIHQRKVNQQEERTDALNYVIDQVTKKTNESTTHATPSINMGVIKKALVESNKQMRI